VSSDNTLTLTQKDDDTAEMEIICTRGPTDIPFSDFRWKIETEGTGDASSWSKRVGAFDSTDSVIVKWTQKTDGGRLFKVTCWYDSNSEDVDSFNVFEIF